jgi:hypothetical protein
MTMAPLPAVTLTRVPLAPKHGAEVRHIVDNPSDRILVGPTANAWRRQPGDYGRVFYQLTDGGRTASPDGIVRKASMLRAVPPRPGPARRRPGPPRMPPAQGRLVPRQRRCTIPRQVT